VIRHFASPPASPRARGQGFGEAHRAEIQRTVAVYRDLFVATAGQPFDAGPLGPDALAAIDGYAPDLGEEVRGLAEGAALPAETVAALNARTEILGRAGRVARGECSTVVSLGEEGEAPVSLQTWDWHEELADCWLVWTIEHEDGRTVHTLTEYGIVGKIGVNDAGVGVHLNILHHQDDGRVIGVPVHVVARHVLDAAAGITPALSAITGAAVSASSSITVVSTRDAGSAAVSVEASPAGPRFVLPDPDGVLVHTNHFLAPQLSEGDREYVVGPDSFVRLDALRRRLRRLGRLDEASVLGAMNSHLGGGGAVCCHPDPGAPLGERYTTLATVALDLDKGSMRVRAGGPCADTGWWSPR
jgi:isopenicillin-N N-acyltransferase-like protein